MSRCENVPELRISNSEEEEEEGRSNGLHRGRMVTNHKAMESCNASLCCVAHLKYRIHLPCSYI